MKDIDLGQRGDEFWCYSLGICAASVCSSLEPRAIATELNRRVDEGLARLGVTPSSLCWAISDDATFAGGEPNPCACDDHPKTHKHYLLEG